MTRDDIQRWMREAWNSTDASFFEAFASLVAAHERASCAAICDEEASGIGSTDAKIMATMIGERIRVRGGA